MNWIQRLVLGLALINQMLPAILQAIATGQARFRAVQVKAGSTYRLSGAGEASTPDERPDDLLLEKI